MRKKIGLNGGLFMEEGVHEELQRLLVETARNLQLIGYMEYHIDSYLLDVVWMKDIEGCPFAVFEITSLADLHKAVGRLKDARIKYGRPFLYLVIKKEEMERAQKKITDSFPELSGRLMILTPEEIRRYHKTAKNFANMIGGFFTEKPHLMFRKTRFIK